MVGPALEQRRPLRLSRGDDHPRSCGYFMTPRGRVVRNRNSTPPLLPHPPRPVLWDIRTPAVPTGENDSLRRAYRRSLLALHLKLTCINWPHVSTMLFIPNWLLSKARSNKRAVRAIASLHICLVTNDREPFEQFCNQTYYLGSSIYRNWKIILIFSYLKTILC